MDQAFSESNHMKIYLYHIQDISFTPNSKGNKQELALISHKDYIFTHPKFPSKTNDHKDNQEALLTTVDRRRPIIDTKLERFPYSSIVCLISKFKPYSTIGSGVLVGPRHVLTCAHNVQNKSGKASSIIATPAREGENTPIYGTAEVIMAYMFKDYPQEPSNDVALLVLSKDFEEKCGYFGMIAMPDERLEDETLKIHVTGYGQSEDPNLAGIMLTDKRKGIVNGESTLKLYQDYLTYNIDTTKGNSGSPVWIKKGFEAFVIGVHNYSGKKKNKGARLSQVYIKNLVKLINKSINLESQSVISIPKHLPSNQDHLTAKRYLTTNNILTSQYFTNVEIYHGDNGFDVIEYGDGLTYIKPSYCSEFLLKDGYSKLNDDNLLITYHGTNPESVLSILKNGLKAAGETIEGKKIPRKTYKCDDDKDKIVYTSKIPYVAESFCDFEEFEDIFIATIFSLRQSPKEAFQNEREDSGFGHHLIKYNSFNYYKLYHGKVSKYEAEYLSSSANIVLNSLIIKIFSSRSLYEIRGNDEQNFHKSILNSLFEVS